MRSWIWWGQIANTISAGDADKCTAAVMNARTSGFMWLRRLSVLRVSYGRASAVLLATLGVFAPGAALAADFSWSGGDVGTSSAWSDPLNWSGMTAPSGSVGTLTFPALTNSAYGATDDISGLSANAIQIDGGYNMFGSVPLSLGAGGLSIAPGNNSVTLGPIALAANQTWTISGSVWAPTITGSGAGLTVHFTGAARLQLGASADTELGPVVVNGDATALSVDELSLPVASLNSSDGNPVKLNHVQFDASGHVGPLSVSNASILALQDTAGNGLAAPRVTLDGSSAIWFRVGSQYPATELTSTGTVDLGDAALGLVDAPCSAITVGRIFTLVSAAGGVTGELTDPAAGHVFGGTPIANGGTVSDSDGCNESFQINYSSHTVTARALGPGSGRASTKWHVAVNPIQTFEGHLTSGVLGLATARYVGQAPSAADLHATVDWGDRSHSSATLTKRARTPAGTAVFEVVARHTYKRNDIRRYSITLRQGGVQVAGGSGPVEIDSAHSEPFIFADPGNTPVNGRGLLIPRAALADQPAFVSYHWHFSDGTRSVLDDPVHRAESMCVAEQLARVKLTDCTRQDLNEHPSGDYNTLRDFAIALGMLPRDAAGGPFGAGSISESDVRETARLWVTYFPRHIVVHIWDLSGQQTVSLTTRDASGHEQTSKDAHIDVAGRDWCPAWLSLGLLIPGASALFPGETICQTVTRLQSVDDVRRRAPDFVSVDYSASLDWFVGAQWGASLTLARTRGAPTASDVFLSVGFGASAGVGSGESVTVSKGWVGLATGAAPDTRRIDGFIKGGWLTGGAGAALILTGHEDTIRSSGGAVGEEIALGAGPDAHLSAYLNYSCSVPLSAIPGAPQLAQTFTLGLVRATASDSGDRQAQVDAKSIVRSLKSSPNFNSTLAYLVSNCNAFS